VIRLIPERSAILLALAFLLPVNMAASPHAMAPAAVHIKTPQLSLNYDLTAGLWSCRWAGGAAVSGASCYARLSSGTLLTPADYSRHECGPADRTIASGPFGRAQRIVVHHRAAGKPELRQTLSVYPGKPWLTVDLAVISPTPLASNDLGTVVIDADRQPGAGLHLDAGEKPHALFVPFDNDKFVRYTSEYATSSYEVTALFDNASRHGFVAGSLTHDVWKTGIEMKEFGPRSLGLLRVYGGASGEWTHDSQPHGLVTGRTVTAPQILIGYFPDWRDGLETYAGAVARLQPPLVWKGTAPAGWNSWYAYGTKVDQARTLEIADYFKQKLQPAGFDKASPVTINFDSYWDNLSEPQLIETARRLHAAGQKAGIYWSPFTYWGDDFERLVPGTDGHYKFRDILLKDASGNLLPKLDDGHAVDPTHPGAARWIDWNLARFARWGFDLIKLDFINAGSLEGVHHDPKITTGIAAYNAGMRRIVADLSPAKIGRPFFISLSIAPQFPSGYGHSRRISCDVGGDLNATAYMLNGLTFGWWAAGPLYPYNDPDMLVLAASDQEARTRVNSCVITGAPLLDSDDLTKPELQRRAEKHLTNAAILAIARSGRPFRPVEGDAGGAAARIFVRDDRAGGYLVAVFNYDSARSHTEHLDFGRLGLQAAIPYHITELWSGTTATATKDYQIDLAPGESRILRFDR